MSITKGIGHDSCFVYSDVQVVYKKGFHLKNPMNMIVVVLLCCKAGTDTGLVGRFILRNRTERLLYLFCSLRLMRIFSSGSHVKQLDLLPCINTSCYKH